MITRRDFLYGSAFALAGSGIAATPGCASFFGGGSAARLAGGRYLTINAVIRVNQIEATRTLDVGYDETNRNTPEAMRRLSDAVRAGDPAARITWAFSWQALTDARPQFVELRRLAREYHDRFGDDITFFPGGYFAPMYASRKQVNEDLSAALDVIRRMVGGGFNPGSVIAGYLAADNMRHLAEQEGVHAAQATIWSQYGIDNGDGDGSICYPYYPSLEHICKPARGKADFIDCVALDGWTCDFLCARRFGFEDGFNSRLGIGPVEAYGQGIPIPQGYQEVLSVTENHFSDENVARNGFGWLTVCWEIELAVRPKGPMMLAQLTQWLREIKARWPNATVPTEGEFANRWRVAHPTNDSLDYRFVRRGSGIGGSEPNLELAWAMNSDFRLATLRDWQKGEQPLVIDFTRYDLPAHEPPDPVDPHHPVRNWSLINRINQKRRRPQDAPVPFSALAPDDLVFIRRRIRSVPGLNAI